MAEKRKRRKWSDDEKRRIIAQTKVPGVSVPEVAHRYDVNANLIFKWIRDPRYTSSVDNEPEALNFLPVEVTQNSLPAERAQEAVDMPGSLKIVLANGHHLEISGTFDTDAVVRLVRGLSQ
jgi:transposase